MASSLAPAFVRINYASAFGAHVMTLPTVPIVTGINAPSFHDFDLRGAALSVECDDAIRDFVNLIKYRLPPEGTYIDYTLFTQADEVSPAVPVYSAALGIAGAGVSGGWSKAVQETVTFRTDAFGLFKLVFLDAPSFGSFDKRTALAGDTPLTNIVNYVIADVTWLAGRDGGRPATFLQSAKTLNEKLRRSYNMN